MIELVLLDQAVPAMPSPVQTDLRSLYAQGVEARFAGRFDEALGMFEALLATNPEDVDSRLNAALCLIALERLDEAESELEHVINQAPDYVDAYTALARVRRMKGDAQGSHEFIDAAETLSSDHADYAAMREQATVILDEVTKISADVRRLDDRIAKLQSHYDGGLEMMRQARISTDKITRRADKIEHLELNEDDPTSLTDSGPQNTGPLL